MTLHLERRSSLVTWREQLATEVGMTYSLERLKKEWEEEIKGKQ